MNRRLVVAALLVALVLGTIGYALFARRTPVRVAILNVSGYADTVTTWMPFRVTLGFTNTGRELLTIRRIHVEPDFEGFTEAFGVQTYELTPALLLEPGSSLSYQTGVTVLNAGQLAEGPHALVLRIRLEQDNGEETVTAFPARFTYARQAAQRRLELQP